MNIFTIAASFISGLLCSMGFGGGSVLIIFLTSFMNIPQKEAQGINLLFFIPCALYSVIRYKKDNLIEKKLIKPFVICGIAGVAAGYSLISFISAGLLRKTFGIFLIIMGAKDLLAKN
ncbi:MAG: sulfite exporter TauE/SafE family protein [Clostridia bacterium]|nr:sulfite exporter TauE/SafE family protein [Clostridia bacterium]